MVIVLPSLSWSQINTEDYIPYRDIEATDSGIVVTYMFRGGIHQPDPLHQGAKFWKIPGFGLNDNATEPGFPFRWDSFTIPDDAEVNVTLLDSVYTDTLFALAPAYPPLLNSDTIGYTPERVPLITPYMGFYPNSAVLKGDIQAYRGQGIVRVATLPVQYNYQSGTVRAFSRIKYLVSFTDVNTRTKIRGRNYVSELADNNISLSDHFLENTTLNYRLSDNGRRNIQTRSGGQQAVLDNRDYLIISTPTYTDAVNKFAEWKRTKGFRVHVLLRNDWTVKSVKKSIMDLYNTEGVNLYYLMIIGKTVIPAYANSNNNKNYHVTDYYYGCMEDTINAGESRNVFASIRRGRLLAKSSTMIMGIINKIIDYEKNPPLDSIFYKNALHCAYFQDDDHLDLNNLITIHQDSIEDRRFTLTSEEVKSYVEGFGKTVNRVYYAKDNVFPMRWNTPIYSNGDSIPFLLRKPFFSWDGSSQDIIDNINSHKFYVLYNGHGKYDRWENINFITDSISQLNNSVFQPVVFSVTCLTGKYTKNKCFAEAFLKKTNGGCVSIIAASEVSYCGNNDSFCEGMFNAIWPYPGLSYHFPSITNNVNNPNTLSIYDMGSILDYGLYFMSNFGSISTSSEINDRIIYNREIFHLFGDPSMMIYTNQPVPISNPAIRVNNNTISVQTTDEDARISFYTPGTTPIVDSYLGNSVDYTTTADSVIICIDRHNCIPYVVTYYKNEFIQNETITDSRTYVGKNIKVGRNVTTTKPEGDVVIDGADVMINGGDVELHSGTTIINSNVIINPRE